MFKVSDLKYGTQNDFGLAIVSTDNLGESSEKRSGGRVEFFYRAPQACFLMYFSSDVDCDGDVCKFETKMLNW